MSKGRHRPTVCDNWSDFPRLKNHQRLDLPYSIFYRVLISFSDAFVLRMQSTTAESLRKVASDWAAGGVYTVPCTFWNDHFLCALYTCDICTYALTPTLKSTNGLTCVEAGKRACRPEGPIQPPVDVSFTTRKENKHRIQISPQQTHDLIVQCLPILSEITQDVSKSVLSR
jgi:hypothetical protein